MMQAQSPMESTQGVDFTGENRSRAAVAQLVERSFRKASSTSTKPAEINDSDSTPKKLGVLLGAFNPDTDPELTAIAAWPDLSLGIRESLAGIARASATRHPH